MYSNSGIALFFKDSFPSIIKYFSLYPYFGTSIGSIFSSLFAAYPCAGRYFGEYFNNFTSLAMHISLKLTCPESNFLESDKISYLTLLKSFVSISLLSICVIAKDVKGRPSLLTVYKPFPSYFGKLSAVS